ncbi:MAG: hypothetical protein J5944_06870 [Lentisphaeria bacterium]|nr:hypothetical protein [Lentisphaeria bacterium]
MLCRLSFLLFAFAALGCTGCASSDPGSEKTISMSLDVWDCRGDCPRRVTPDDSDPLFPHFSGLEFPQDGTELNDLFSAGKPDAQKP